MFENLSDKFERAFKVLKGQGQITEINIAESLKEVRRALLDADVNFNTAKSFTNWSKFPLTLCQFTTSSLKLQTCLYFASDASVADFNSSGYTGTRKSFKSPVGLYPRSHRF
jgi:hypothetical protein